MTILESEGWHREELVAIAHDLGAQIAERREDGDMRRADFYELRYRLRQYAHSALEQTGLEPSEHETREVVEQALTDHGEIYLAFVQSFREHRYDEV